MKPLIVANWKMNPISRKQAEHLFESIRKEICGIQNIEVILCPPLFIWILFQRKQAKDIKLAVKIFLGQARTLYWRISPQMLKDRM